jgi:hypothetical protein
VRVHRDADGRIQLRGGRLAAVAAVADRSVARHGRDVAVGGHLANDVVVSVGDEEVSPGVDRHALRVAQDGGGGRSAVAAELVGFVSEGPHRGCHARLERAAAAGEVDRAAHIVRCNAIRAEAERAQRDRSDAGAVGPGSERLAVDHAVDDELDRAGGRAETLDLRRHGRGEGRGLTEHGREGRRGYRRRRRDIYEHAPVEHARARREVGGIARVGRRDRVRAGVERSERDAGVAVVIIRG